MGSTTSHIGNNPGFSVIDLDEDFLIPKNIKTYYMNLNHQNSYRDGHPPEWKLLHDYLDTYDLKDMSPSSMLELSNQMRTN